MLAVRTIRNFVCGLLRKVCCKCLENQYEYLLLEHTGTLLGNIRKAKHAHHKSHINAVVFSERGRKMFSGDNLGILIVWRLNGPSNRAESFEVLRQIKDNLPGHSINTIRLRASSTVKLDAITTVTSTPEIIVLAEGSVFQAHETMSQNAISKRFAGLKNIDLSRKLSCVVSPDGRYLMAGSEDGNMYVLFDGTSKITRITNTHSITGTSGTQTLDSRSVIPQKMSIVPCFLTSRKPLVMWLGVRIDTPWRCV